MPSNTRVSTASGVPAHLRTQSISGVGGNPTLPQMVESQHLPPSGAIQGVVLAVDPLLAQAGAYYSQDRHLVRKIVGSLGEPTVIDGRLRQPVRTSERFVAPSGMTLEQARVLGLDFYSPAYGWIRAGVKREQEFVENLGHGGDTSGIEYIDVSDEASVASGEV